jgi:hypothetical protein
MVIWEALLPWSEEPDPRQEDQEVVQEFTYCEQSHEDRSWLANQRDSGDTTAPSARQEPGLDNPTDGESFRGIIPLALAWFLAYGNVHESGS